MFEEYVNVKNELHVAQQEVYELTRLLKEAQARQDQLMRFTPTFTWKEWFLHMLGFQIKSN